MNVLAEIRTQSLCVEDGLVISPFPSNKRHCVSQSMNSILRLLNQRQDKPVSGAFLPHHGTECLTGFKPRPFISCFRQPSCLPKVNASLSGAATFSPISR